ncbi:metaxin-like protein [Wolffia australiana]
MDPKENDNGLPGTREDVDNGSLSSSPSEGMAGLMAEEAAAEEGRLRLVLVARKGGFGLPTACPSCLPVYISLKLANARFDLQFDGKNPDSEHIPFVEFGDYVAYNGENGGVVDKLKEDGLLNLDSGFSGQSIPDWISTKAMISSWLADAALYELWVESDGTAADKIYFCDLPWPIRKALHWKQSRAVKNVLGITKLNGAEKEDEIYRKARQAYEALSLRLGDQTFFFEDRPTSLDALFLAHALFVLHTSHEASSLRKLLTSHDNLVKYAENLRRDYLEGGPSSSSVPGVPAEPATPSPAAKPSSSRWTWSSKPKPKQKRERTEEEKSFRRRAKYFLLTQLVSVVVFLTILGPIAAHEELEMDDDDDDDDMGYGY